MSVHSEYRRALRWSGLWLFAWPAFVWLLAWLHGGLPEIVAAIALGLGALNAASWAFDAGRLSAERWRQ